MEQKGLSGGGFLGISVRWQQRIKQNGKYVCSGLGKRGYVAVVAWAKGATWQWFLRQNRVKNAGFGKLLEGLRQYGLIEG